MGLGISTVGGTHPTPREALRDSEAPSPRSAGALEPSGPLAALAGAGQPPARPPQGESAPERRARADLSPLRGRPDTAQPGSHAAELTSSKSQGADASHPVGAKGLLDLPKDLLWQIADRMPPNDVTRLGRANRALLETMGERMARLRAVVTNSRPELLQDQPGALSTALAALNQLPAHELARERSTLMKPFAEMLDRAATPEKLHAAALQLFTAAGLESPARAEVLTLIASRVDRMPRAEHVDVLDALTAETLMTLSKADMQVPLQAMARQLKLYPADRRFNMVALFACQNEFGHMVGTSKDACLDPPQRAQVLVTLAGEMKSMADEGPKTWGYLLDRAKTLPPEHRRPVLDALGRQCGAFLPSVRDFSQLKLAEQRAQCPP